MRLLVQKLNQKTDILPIDQWNFEMAVGLTGAMLCSKVFGYEMAKKGKGVIFSNILGRTKCTL